MKKCTLEFDILKNRLLENSYVAKNYRGILNEILIDCDLIKNPLYNSWIIAAKEIIKSNGLDAGSDFSWNSIFITIDSNKYERIIDKLILDLLAIRLFYDLEKSRKVKYKIKICLYRGFHIPLYYKSSEKINITCISAYNGELKINNKKIKKGFGCKNDLKECLYIYNDSDLKYLCNNVPSVIIDETEIIKRSKIKRAFSLIKKQFPFDIIDLLSFCDCTYMIYSTDKMFYSGNDEMYLGLIYLPNISNEYYLAECILHEFMHQKLCCIEDIAKIFNGSKHLDEYYYSPWRSDARPLRMILHGLFVFTAVVEFWHCFINDPKLKRESIENCYLRIMQNKIAIKILTKHSKLTKLGIHILCELDHVNNKIEHGIKDKLTKTSKLSLNKQIAEHKKKYNMYVS